MLRDEGALMKYIQKFLLLVSTVLIYSCSNLPLMENKPVASVTQCIDPRSTICTMDYQPVCATRDTGVRCITTPCPSTETAIYSNGCGACADPKVLSYISGKCK